LVHLKTIKDVAAKLDLFAFEKWEAFVEAVYAELKKIDKDYSYKLFTEQLGFGKCNAMYLLVNGYRPLTKKGGERLIEGLGLSGKRRRYFLALVGAGAAKSAADQEKCVQALVDLKRESAADELDQDQIEFFSHWHHAVILETLGLHSASDDPHWLQENIWPRLSTAVIEESLQFLLRAGFLMKDRKKGRLVPVGDVVTARKVYGMAMVSYHQQLLDIGKRAIIEKTVEERDITSLTLAVSAADYETIVEQINALREKLAAMARETKASDSVVHINIQAILAAQAKAS
jgi:uncharacterized protein (TIGR02147 family)